MHWQNMHRLANGGCIGCMLADPVLLEGYVIVQPVVHPAVKRCKIDGGDIVVRSKVLALLPRPPARTCRHMLAYINNVKRVGMQEF